MNLSYSLRLLCLLTVVAGCVQGALQLVLRLNARALLRRMDAAGSRLRERLLYAVQMAPLLIAIFAAGALCLPEYLWYEPAHEAEPVSWITLLLAAIVGIWFGSALLGGLRIALRTLRFAAACRRSGRIVRHLGSGTPILALAGPNPPVALVGFLHPFVLVSTDLLEAGSLQPEALRIALDHERSHAAHHDNWKLLTLSFLPRLHADPWLQHWQRAADWAADDDAVRGDPALALLLADAIVCAARLVRAFRAPVICAALTSADAGLAIRIDRLLNPRRTSRPANATVRLGVAAAVLCIIGAGLIASPWIYGISESILHLGGF